MRPVPTPTDASGTGWAETYAGDDPVAEEMQFEQLARTIATMQRVVALRAGEPPMRALHAKPTLAVAGAELRFRDDLAPDLLHGFVQPDATYPVVLRFSNAAQQIQPDAEPDMRGVALRVHVAPDTSIDLLMTNDPVSHARDARQFVEFAAAFTRHSRGGALLSLTRLFGVQETARMVRTVTRARRRRPSSLFTETYWSRGAITWGPALAVRYLLRPSRSTVPVDSALRRAAAPGPDGLAAEAAARLSAGPVVMALCLQRYRDPVSTPIEDTAVEWSQEDSPAIPIAELTLPRRDVTGSEARRDADAIEAMAFSPWNTVVGFRPLGNLNRARDEAYRVSAEGRTGTPSPRPAGSTR